MHVSVHDEDRCTVSVVQNALKTLYNCLFTIGMRTISSKFFASYQSVLNIFKPFSFYQVFLVSDKS